MQLKRKPVSTLELFFDLVFVYTLSQITILFAHAHGSDFFAILMILMILLWVYGGYAWLTNSIDMNKNKNKVLILLAMTAFLMIGISLPTALSSNLLIFALSYFVMILIHSYLFTTAQNIEKTSLLNFIPTNILGSLVLVFSSLLPEHLRIYGFALAVFIMYGRRLSPRKFNIVLDSGHFAERHGLVILIALGEAIVSIGVSIGEQVITFKLLGFLVLGMLLITSLWWSYFGTEDNEIEEALERIPTSTRAEKAL